MRYFNVYIYVIDEFLKDEFIIDSNNAITIAVIGAIASAIAQLVSTPVSDINLIILKS